MVSSLAIGLLSAVGQWFFMKAFHHAKPSQLGPFCYMAVVYSGFIEWIFWEKFQMFLLGWGFFLSVLGEFGLYDLANLLRKKALVD
ncbi:MAG TPA: hypothetical protein VGJ00_00775 [Rhabdochlamydiaceae bacterium]|jgi:drug/metabolite transporter (DMT)-like permease